MNLERMGAWYSEYFPTAVENLGEEALTPLWRQAYTWQITFTELSLQRLGVNRDVRPNLIPGEDKISNFNPITAGEIGLINVIGMPGAGKDTMIKMYDELGKPRVSCAPEEGYFWTQEFDPNMKTIWRRHLRAYGGTEMEVDEMVDKLGGRWKGEKGVGVMNRSNEDNFLAFAYSFFLNGFIGVSELITSQRFYHFFQYSPTINLRDKLVSIDDITAATVVLMVDPMTSLEQKGRIGRIMNAEFLSLMYCQYLRMICRMRDDSYRNLVVLDMSGDITTSFKKFRKTLDNIIG